MFKTLSAAAIALLIATPAMAQTATPATPAAPAVKAAPADTTKADKDKADKAKGKSSHNVDLGKQQAQVPAGDKKAAPAATPATPAKPDVKTDANRGDTRKVN